METESLKKTMQMLGNDNCCFFWWIILNFEGFSEFLENTLPLANYKGYLPWTFLVYWKNLPKDVSIVSMYIYTNVENGGLGEVKVLHNR